MRIKEGKNEPKKLKKGRNFKFWNAECSLLRVEGFFCGFDVFFCGFDVLYEGLGISKLQFWSDPDPASKKYGSESGFSTLPETQHWRESTSLYYSRNWFCLAACHWLPLIRIPSLRLEPVFWHKVCPFLACLCETFWDFCAPSSFFVLFKGTQDWEFFWLRFWILYYFIVSYDQILRFWKKKFLIGPLLEEIRLFRLVWD
jgi:hypothetical protein